MSDRALVVGIEKYPSKYAAPLQGPAFNALRFALWLHQVQKLHPCDIILLLNKDEAWTGKPEEADLDQLWKDATAAGIDIRTGPSYKAVMKAWQEELLPRPGEEGTVWVYWCGHGVMFPEEREAVLCEDLEFRKPTFVYLSELRDSLNSVDFRDYNAQRLIFDVCSEPVTASDLGIGLPRPPQPWATEQSQDRVVLNAVALGQKAQALKGSSLFTNALLEELGHSKWPPDVKNLWEKLSNNIRSKTNDKKLLPRVQIASTRYSDAIGLDSARTDETAKLILDILNECDLPESAYDNPYLWTSSPLTSNNAILEADTLPKRISQLAQMSKTYEYSGFSRALIEFLLRVRMRFPAETGPLGVWLDGERNLQKGPRATLTARLKAESDCLVLVLELEEGMAPAGKGTSYPAILKGRLCDRSFSTQLMDMDAETVLDREDLMRKTGIFAKRAAERALKLAPQLPAIHVFVNPVFLTIPWQGIPYEKQDAYLGESFQVVVRIRDRLRNQTTYNKPPWEARSKTLRSQPCRDVALIPAERRDSEWPGQFEDQDGLLVLPDGNPGDQSVGSFLKKALRYGQPLATWRITESHFSLSWPDWQEKLRKLLAADKPIHEAPALIHESRGKGTTWSRDTVWLWDDAADVMKLQSVMKEPQI